MEFELIINSIFNKNVTISEAAIILWTLKPKSDIPDIFATSSSSSENENKENWTVIRILRGHIEDVYDLCWSPDSSQLFSGSVDNTAILWDVTKGTRRIDIVYPNNYVIHFFLGKSQTIFSDHKGFVQGVAWDPKNQFVATLSSDRSCRVYSLKTKKCVQKIQQVCKITIFTTQTKQPYCFKTK